jgi:acyl-CoA synthetase (AMP-forming)/AMP-acid ligase II
MIVECRLPNAFFQTFLHTAQSEPSKTCFDLYDQAGRSGREVSFGEMRRHISAAASLLALQGVEKGDIVLIFAQHSVGKLAAFFGAQWLGAIPAFMPPPTVKQDVTAWANGHCQIIERVRPHSVVSEPSCMEYVKDLGVASVISTSDIEACDLDAITMPVDTDVDDIAFLQHSSGTTGLKKGVTVTYRQLMTQLDAYASTIRFDGNSNVVSWLPIYHDMGLIAATLLPMRCGASVRLIDTFAWLSNPSILMELLASFPATYCWLPNFAFNYVAKRSRATLGPNSLLDVRAVINCSEPCKISDMRAFTDRFRENGLREQSAQVCYAAAEYVFAMTQTSLASAIEPLIINGKILEIEHRAVRCAPDNPDAKAVVPVGKVIPGAQITIDENSPDGVVGEIRIAGPSLCSGYFRNEETTRKKFRDGWYLTGDLGFKLDDTFYVTGRADDLIIVRGKNIYAHDVEAIAGNVHGVKPGRSIAFGIDDKSGTQALAVAVEATGDADAKGVQTEVNAQIRDVFGIVPADVCVVDENTLVKTTSGKISRSENRRRYLEGALVQYR